MTPQEYLAAEAEACKRLPPEIVAAFKPVAFEAYAQDWCKPVERLDQLGPWVDCMHDGTERIWRNLGGLTADELRLVDDAADHARRVSAKLGCERTPRDALLQSLIPFRYVEALRPPSVLELGPGSGYLGWMLAENGYAYTALEITQPFYLWQKELWRGYVEHWPWFHRGHPEIFEQAEFIVACHMLNEMSEAALRMLIAGARCPVLVEGWGSQGVRQRGRSIGLFRAAGWDCHTLAEGDAESNHRVDLLLPPGEPRTVDLAAALKVLGGPAA